MTTTHYEILERLKLILGKNPELAKIIKLVKIGQFANEKSSSVYPAIFVDTDITSYDTADKLGSAENNDIQYTAYFIIRIVTSENDAATARISLIQLWDAVQKIIRANPKLANLNDLDPLVARSKITHNSEDAAQRGAQIQTMTAYLKVQIGTQTTILISGVGRLNVLYQSARREYVDYVPHQNTYGKLVGYVAGKESKTRYYTIENITGVLDKLENAKAKKEKISVIVIESWGVNQFIGYLSQANPEIGYDQTPIITLQFQVL